MEQNIQQNTIQMSDTHFHSIEQSEKQNKNTHNTFQMSLTVAINT